MFQVVPQSRLVSHALPLQSKHCAARWECYCFHLLDCPSLENSSMPWITGAQHFWAAISMLYVSFLSFCSNEVSHLQNLTAARSEKSVYWRVDVVILWILRMLRILIFIYELYTLHLKYYFVKGEESECFVQWTAWIEVQQRSILLEASCNCVAFPIIAFSKYFRFEIQWFHLWAISLSVTMSTIMETLLEHFFFEPSISHKKWIFLSLYVLCSISLRRAQNTLNSFDGEKKVMDPNLILCNFYREVKHFALNSL